MRRTYLEKDVDSTSVLECGGDQQQHQIQGFEEGCSHYRSALELALGIANKTWYFKICTVLRQVKWVPQNWCQYGVGPYKESCVQL